MNSLRTLAACIAIGAAVVGAVAGAAFSGASATTAAGGVTALVGASLEARARPAAPTSRVLRARTCNFFMTGSLTCGFKTLGAGMLFSE